MRETDILPVCCYVVAIFSIRLECCTLPQPINLWSNDAISITHQTDGSVDFNSDQRWWRGSDRRVTWREVWWEGSNTAVHSYIGVSFDVPRLINTHIYQLAAKLGWTRLRISTYIRMSSQCTRQSSRNQMTRSYAIIIHFVPWLAYLHNNSYLRLLPTHMKVIQTECKRVDRHTLSSIHNNTREADIFWSISTNFQT